jgi:hypothetical protein
MTFTATTTEAHLSKKVLQCPQFKVIAPKGDPKLLKSEAIEMGLFVELYDVNRDGNPDVATYSAQIDPRLHVKQPIFYEIDLDGDMVPDVLYIDVIGELKCSDLLQYSHEARGGLASWYAN